ncbi:MAG: MAPEG family protein [Gammaproteobacteria bacterium]
MEITLFYTSLITLLAIFLAYKVGIARTKSNTLLGEGNSTNLLQAIRSHANLMEYAPLALILLGLLEMSGVDALKLHLLGATFFICRVLHAYGLGISSESTPYRLVGTLGTWIIMLAMAIYGVYAYLV